MMSNGRSSSKTRGFAVRAGMLGPRPAKRTAVMTVTTGVRVPAALFIVMLFRCLPMGAAPPIRVDTRNLLVSVDPSVCRWSAGGKGSPMQLNDVYFLPGDDASGWKVTSSVNNRSEEHTSELQSPCNLVCRLL